MGSAPPSRRNLPIIQNRAVASSLRSDGSRAAVISADVRGRFVRARRVVYALLIAVWALLPWVRVGGHPALFLDVEHREFYVFGLTFNAQDTFLLFFLMTGAMFAIAFSTALAGRVWCGWACPQTVFLEGIFRPIERLLLGSRERRLKTRGKSSLSSGVATLLTQVGFVIAAAATAHIVLSYFVSIPRLWSMIREGPSAHPFAFGATFVVSALVYGNFAWFREQMCVVLCPYGRIQSALIDEDSLVIGYDELRGEPRGKKNAAGAGDCVDCGRCVVVCPTGIDIRNGLQMDCIGCAQCIDACDEIMTKLGRAPGLVRYDSQNGLMGRPKRVLRPRVFLYAALLVVGASVAAFAGLRRTTYEAGLLRLASAPISQVEGGVRNAFEVHLVNKRGVATSFALEASAKAGQEVVVSQGLVVLEPLQDARVPIFVTVSDGSAPNARRFDLTVRPSVGKPRALTIPILGAR